MRATAERLSSRSSPRLSVCLRRSEATRTRAAWASSSTPLVASAARWMLSTPSIASSSDPAPRKTASTSGRSGDVERADLLAEPLLGLCKRAARGLKLPPRRGALSLQGRRDATGCRRAPTPRARASTRAQTARGAPAAPPTRARRRAREASPGCRQSPPRAVREARRRAARARGWSFPLHRELTVSEGPRPP